MRVSTAEDVLIAREDRQKRKTVESPNLIAVRRDVFRRTESTEKIYLDVNWVRYEDLKSSSDFHEMFRFVLPYLQLVHLPFSLRNFPFHKE